MSLYNKSEAVLLQTIDMCKKSKQELKVCFLLTHVPNPRMNKRINVYKKYGEVSVICTRRKSQNIWNPQVEDVEYNIFDIDLPSSSHLFKRAFVSHKYQKKAMKNLHRIKPDILYCGGLDSLIIATQYKKENKNIDIIYEVADLRETYIEKPKNVVQEVLVNVVKHKERKVFHNVKWLVVTSPEFYNRYYYRLIDKEKMVFIPNAPDKEVFSNYKHKSSGKFTIGFIGGIRYLNQMKMLVDVAGELKCEVLFAGAGGTSKEYTEIVDYCKCRKNVTFTGRYDYEKQIADIYGKVDCVFAVYDASNPNVRIALPNKLYEAILCELPIIVANGTYLSELVKEWGVGCAVSCTDPHELKKEISKLMYDQNYYNKIVAACKEINKSLD